MKQQTWIILTLLFALIIAVFAVINVEPVQVDFSFVQTDAPLILVILLSALLGCLAVASVTYAKFYQLKKEIRQLKKENESFLEQEETSTIEENHGTSYEGDQEIDQQQGEDSENEQKNEWN